MFGMGSRAVGAGVVLSMLAGEGWDLLFSMLICLVLYEYLPDNRSEETRCLLHSVQMGVPAAGRLPQGPFPLLTILYAMLPLLLTCECNLSCLT